jgi:hypothetical protein
LPVSESCIEQLLPGYEERERYLSDIKRQKLLALGLATLLEHFPITRNREMLFMFLMCRVFEPEKCCTLFLKTL